MQYVISFLEGIITFISPCLLPMLPIYISYFAGGGKRSTKKTLTGAIGDGYQALGLTKEDASTAVSMTLVFLSTFFTALGLYHKLARHAGAGTLVPITGFANAVASPAIDFRAEGVVTGTAVKMFSVAGPVIVFGTTASVIYGIILVLLQSF